LDDAYNLLLPCRAAREVRGGTVCLQDHTKSGLWDKCPVKLVTVAAAIALFGAPVRALVQPALFLLLCRQRDHVHLTLPLSMQAGDAITYKELQNMTYNEVRGTGLAAVCPVIEEGTTNLADIKPGSYKLQQLCLEPTKIWVSESCGTICCAP
jgi:hypothetical protein